MKSTKGVSRRTFLKRSSATGIFLALGFPAAALEAVGEKMPPLQNMTLEALKGIEINPFIIIEQSGKITIISHKPDMGQGTWQSIPTVVAEELDVDPATITIKSSVGEKKFGDQLAAGSSSIRGSWNTLRKSGAAAREMLITAAARQWGVPVAACSTANARVLHTATGKSLGYGELIEAASKLPVPAEPKLKAATAFKWIGKPVPKPDVPLKVNGTAVYGMDMKVPGMLYASIERCPTITGKLLSFDDSKAKTVKGVKHVLKSERPFFARKFEGVAVIADTYFGALEGRKKLAIEWDTSAEKEVDSDAFIASLHELAGQEGAVHDKAPEFSTVLEQASKKHTADYETPFLAHSPLEPENALVHVREGECEIWAPVQGPDGAVRAVSEYLGIPYEKVTIHVPFLGGGFGRKAFTDYILEAAYLSRELKAPIKVVWTREDDTLQGPFRSASVSRMEGAVDKEGKVLALHHKIVAPSIQGQLWNGLKENTPDAWAMEGISKHDSPYQVANYKTSFVLAKTSIPIAWWRSVYASASMFGHESFVDELAHMNGKDPLDMRIEMSQADSRYRKVLEALKEKSGWAAKLPAGKGKGCAIAKSFGSIVAHALFMGRNKEGKLRVEKVVSVIDCGTFVNPDTIRAQTEGNIVMGLTAAIKDPIIFKEGKVQQSNFHNYRMLRINEMPEVEVHIMQNNEHPGGVGEPGLPPVAPALANAVFSATGKRIRKLPINLDEV
jgi:isoquinoline 1-oxidoreductase beta subunit